MFGNEKKNSKKVHFVHTEKTACNMQIKLSAVENCVWIKRRKFSGRAHTIRRRSETKLTQKIWKLWRSLQTWPRYFLENGSTLSAVDVSISNNNLYWIVKTHAILRRHTRRRSYVKCHRINYSQPTGKLEALEKIYCLLFSTLTFP